MDICTFDLDRVSYCEWYVCANELINFIEEWWSKMRIPNTLKPKFAFVGGEDLIRSPSGLYKGIEYVDFVDKVMMVPRDIEDKKREKYPLATDVEILPHFNRGLSSTKVRALLQQQHFELENLLDSRTLEYLRNKK